MAQVHLARDQVLDRQVALKLLRSDIGQDEVLRERFLREAKLAARLTHENIVRVYDTGIDEDVPWMAMELVEGRSLRDEMTDSGQMPVGRSLELVEQVLAGLGAAHEAGIVHRDIKPSNVLVNGRAQLSDFGIAKSLQGGGDLTQTNQFLGTPKYTAPEVATGFPATPQSDLYSTAVVLWEMLAGAPPFEHDNALALAMMHQTDDLPALGERRPDLPAALIAAIEAGLAKEPTDRPDHAAGFTALLKAGLSGDTVALAAATAPTAALPRVSIVDPDVPPTVDPDQATVAMPQPQQTAAPGAGGSNPPPRSGDRPSAAQRPPRRRNAPGLILLVVLLIAAAAVAYTTLVDTGTEPDVPATPTATPTVSPTATPTSEPPTDAAPAAPAPTTDATAEPDPVQPVPTATQPQPTGEPAPTQPAEPAPDPQPTVEPTSPATPEPLEPPEPTPEPLSSPA